MSRAAMAILPSQTCTCMPCHESGLSAGTASSSLKVSRNCSAIHVYGMCNRDLQHDVCMDNDCAVSKSVLFKLFLCHIYVFLPWNSRHVMPYLPIPCSVLK